VSTLYIGLMSGTSMDGIDGVLADLGTPGFRVLAHADAPLPAALRSELLALNAPGGPDELHRAALAGNALARAYAGVVAQLLSQAGVDAAAVRAIGAHGQTVRHQPGRNDGVGYTLQLNAPALLAELTGIAVAADFRSRDLAAGGQGAPLVPIFHSAVFGRPDEALAVLNLGGISNLTRLDPARPLIGFDCGPANVLMDHWAHRHLGQAYDADGAWAAQGQLHPGLMARMQSEPYFALPPPKSTGRDLFHPPWLDAHLAACPGVSAVDVQHTLAELTAQSCAQALRTHAPASKTLLVCGGGALNAHLMQRLQALLPGVQVASTASRGLPPTQVEACAFAWLAQALVEGRPGNDPAVTGARGLRVLGALYPA
jgi:anhydro-N-acetylmuramic acid kinase